MRFSDSLNQSVQGMKRSGGKILVDQLTSQGCDMIFTVPGESFVSALDSIHDTDAVQTIVCRHEGSASMMADAYGKLTGRPGVCFVGRGAGAAHAMSGMHIAKQDQTPLLLLVGLIRRGHEGREAWQEIDVGPFFGGVAKWSAVVRETDRIPEYVSRAYQQALSGRPGPVVLGLPEDVLNDTAVTQDARTVVVAEAAPTPAAMESLASAFDETRRPILIVGGPGWSKDVQARFEAFADRFDLPVATPFRHQDYFDNRHRCYVGDCHIGMDEKLEQRIKDADLLIVVGSRLDEISTRSYSLVQVPTTNQFFVHVHPDADTVGRLTTPDLAINSSAGAFAQALEHLKPPSSAGWSDWLEQAKADYDSYRVPIATPGPVRLEDVVTHLSQTLPDDAVIANGAGNYTLWIHRYFQFKGYRTQLAPVAGVMGYGLPAAIAASLKDARRPNIAIAGDGCFLMTGQEMATAMHHRLALIVIVINNGIYGSIRMHQERQFPGRIEGTSLTNPDFVAFARSFGAHAERVDRTEDFPAAFERAMNADGPALLELALDPESLTPRATLTQIRDSKQR